MLKTLFLTVIATVVLTACNKNDNPDKTTEEEKYTIIFGQDEYVELNNSTSIFVTPEANSDFIIEKAVDPLSNIETFSEEGGQKIETDMFTILKIEGHNRLQVKMNENSEQKERDFILYVKNGNEQGKLTFNQRAYNPNMAGYLGSILFDPVSYNIGAKGGEIVTAIADGGIVTGISCIWEIGGEIFRPREYDYPSFFKGEGLLSATIIDIKDENDPKQTSGTKLKLDVEPNNTGKDREIRVEGRGDIIMYSYVIVFQSAN